MSDVKDSAVSGKGAAGGSAAAARAGPSAMDRLLSEVIRRQPVTCRPPDSIESALRTMHGENVGSLIVTDDGRKPLGIFTLPDLLTRVALPRRDLAGPISAVMSDGVVTLPSSATAYEAAIAMVREGIRHVVVVDAEGTVVGIVSEKDLFALQRTGLRQLSQEIRTAPDLASLVALAKEVRGFAQSRLAEGVSSEQLTRLIASLNDLLTRRVLELESGALEKTAWCWLALGSEGRHEQTLATDQDNGLVFEVPAGTTADALRERLLPFAQRVNKGLEACGFPLCTGEVMASNPRWCLGVEEWRREFAHWIESGNPEALLNSTIFFDFRAVGGEKRLGDDLRAWLVGAIAGNDRFLRQMAENALRNRPPLGWLRDFTVSGAGEQRGTVDLKINGAALFVDAARIFALAAGVAATSTAERLRAAAEPLHIPGEELEAWIGAFFHIQALRLQTQQRADTGGKAANRVAPRTLNILERTILRESLRQAQSIQARLALNYQL